MLGQANREEEDEERERQRERQREKGGLLTCIASVSDAATAFSPSRRLTLAWA